MPFPQAAEILHMSFTIPPDHPSLPGHFPGAPVVPGVVILAEVLAQVPAPADGARRLVWVKFLRPLLPGQQASVTLALGAQGWRFSVMHAATELVQGLLAP
jgi:3-hydroxymyristoyl/3-hydroxydecanoyl-(acyl carrier protein) dehydratase